MNAILAYKMEIKLAPCASRCPVTSALRNWRHDISRDAPLCNAAPPRFIFGTVSRKMRKERCRRKGFLTATATQKTHVDSAIKKSLLWLNDKAPGVPTRRMKSATSCVMLLARGKKQPARHSLCCHSNHSDKPVLSCFLQAEKCKKRRQHG